MDKDVDIGNIKWVGETTHCVNCGKKIKSKWVKTGHVIRHVKEGKEGILASFCSGICLRDLEYKNPNWNGMTWIDDYGIKKSEY